MESKFETNGVFKVDVISQFQRSLQREINQEFPDVSICIYSPVENLQKILELENQVISEIERQIELLGINKNRYAEVENALNNSQIIFKLIDFQPVTNNDLVPICESLNIDCSSENIRQFDKVARLFSKQNFAAEYVIKPQMMALGSLSHVDLYIIIYSNNIALPSQASVEINNLIESKLSLAGGNGVEEDDTTDANEDQMSKVIQAKQISPRDILLKKICRFQK